MVEYRFVTPTRIGKWYRSLLDAQKFAFRIGAGFLSERTSSFVVYPGVRLERRHRAESRESARDLSLSGG